MSTRSSSDSWSGGRQLERVPDIIDLDSYMRGGVRPQLPYAQSTEFESERLVVDGGGAAAALPVGEPPQRPTSDSSATTVLRDKRYSHDSGLSDGSYRRRRTHRRNGDSRQRISSQGRNNSRSMRKFRVVCEQALKNQQEQIARVAELCERLSFQAQRASQLNCSRGGGKQKISDTCSQDSSDLSSSSRSQSTRNKVRKDKDRTDECKTYKIIMNKLDELNRLFGSRARSSPVSGPRRPVPCVPCPASTRSVSVTDKDVTAAFALTDQRPSFLSPRGASYNNFSPPSQRDCVDRPQLCERGVGSETRVPLIARLAATRAHQVDIAPRHTATPRPPLARSKSGRLNVATEHVFACDSITSAACEPHNIDLNDPLRFYAQSKQLLEKRSCMPKIRAPSVDDRSRQTRSSDKRCTHALKVSLCARCQEYWRTITDMAAQLFTRTENEIDTIITSAHANQMSARR